jgi:hypothetical protein
MRTDIWSEHPEYVNNLKMLRASGTPASRIAMEMNLKFGTDFTRNAIIGKMGRLKLPRPKRDARHTMKRPAKPVPRETKRLDPFRAAHLDAAMHIEAKQAVELPPDQSEFAVSFKQLREHHCRWPIDQPSGPIWYCGAQKAEQSYCSRHAAIGFRPVSRR